MPAWPGRLSRPGYITVLGLLERGSALGRRTDVHFRGMFQQCKSREMADQNQSWMSSRSADTNDDEYRIMFPGASRSPVWCSLRQSNPNFYYARRDEYVTETVANRVGDVKMHQPGRLFRRVVGRKEDGTFSPRLNACTQTILEVSAMVVAEKKDDSLRFISATKLSIAVP